MFGKLGKNREGGKKTIFQRIPSETQTKNRLYTLYVINRAGAQKYTFPSCLDFCFYKTETPISQIWRQQDSCLTEH